VYRLTAAVSSQFAEQFFGRARSMARSFRPLTPEERESIRVERLAIARARDGETLEAFSKRVANAWDSTETAVWNGLRPDARLGAEQAVKIARSEIYLTRGEAAPRAGGAAATPRSQPSR
jgi:predicted Zn-dependent protease